MVSAKAVSVLLWRESVRWEREMWEPRQWPAWHNILTHFQSAVAVWGSRRHVTSRPHSLQGNQDVIRQRLVTRRDIPPLQADCTVLYCTVLYTNMYTNTSYTLKPIFKWWILMSLVFRRFSLAPLFLSVSSCVWRDSSVTNDIFCLHNCSHYWVMSPADLTGPGYIKGITLTGSWKYGLNDWILLHRQQKHENYHQLPGAPASVCLWLTFSGKMRPQL